MEREEEHHGEEVHQSRKRRSGFLSFLRKLERNRAFSSTIESLYLVVDNLLLFLGLTLMSSALLSFKHGRYCDGTLTDHYACVNSATYYEYSGLTIAIFVLGSLMVALWHVKRTTTVYYEE